MKHHLAALFLILLAVVPADTGTCAGDDASRLVRNFNSDWKFKLGDHTGAEKTSFDDKAWSAIGLPHSFSMPYFMHHEFYTGYGWYRKNFEVPAEWNGKRISLEFEAAFQDAEIFVNGEKAGAHRGGYVGFPIDITMFVKPGANLVAVRLNNLWKADLAPRAGDHTFCGGLYRDVRLVVTDPLHVAWHGTFVTTPTLAAKKGTESTVQIQTEVRNDSGSARKITLRTDIIGPKDEKVASVSSNAEVPANGTLTVDQTTGTIPNPRLWNPETPVLYQAVTTVLDGTTVLDRCVTTFGFRWTEWTADRGFFLNGRHVYLRGANVHQDHAGWGDAVTNAAHDRDVRMVKEAGFNFIRGSHYPKDPAFGAACDKHGVMWLSENIFWGMGGSHADGGWSASAYPVTPQDEAGFDQSVLDSLSSMIRIHRNHPSVITWSMCNEAFFTDSSMDKVISLLKRSVDLTRRLDPSRPVTIGGSQRPLDKDRIDKLGDIAAYNGDGAMQPAFQNPGVPSMVSEYGSVVVERPGKFDPGWGDLTSFKKAGDPPPWRAGEAVWCMYDHGSHGGAGLARMGIVDYFRVPKRAFFWYREQYAGVAAPAWPVDGKPAKIELTSDKPTITAADGTDDVQLSIRLLDSSGKPVSNSQPVTLTVISGPGEFPTGPSITFSPPGNDDAADIQIRDGQAAIAFRSYHAGASRILATSPGLKDAGIEIRTLGSPVYQPGVTPAVAARPYARFRNEKTEVVEKVADVLCLNRPTKASSSRSDLPSALANDGNPATAWRAEKPGASWQVFLEVTYDVERVTLNFPEEANHRYAIDVAGGDLQWRTVIDQSDTTRTDKRRLHAGDFGKNLSYIRVRFTTTPGSPVPALAEVQVGGSDAGKGATLTGKAAGTVIGTPGSYQNNPACTREAAFDGRLDTWFDSTENIGAWAGLDFGAKGAARIRSIGYAPRFQQGNDTFPTRMVGGRFQGANRPDFSDAEELHKITTAPKPGELTKVSVESGKSFRYVRYLSPDGGSGNVSEISFFR